MTERFKFICDDEKCFFKDGNKALYCYEVVDLLNSLSDENEQLKKQLDETIEGLHKEITTSENAFEGLMNENKELRDACKNYDWYKLYNQLRNENEQLKEDIENLKITIKAGETLIDVCEKKFNELGYIITVDDDGYVIE